MLSAGQLAQLAAHGEERRAEVGDVLFRVGDRRYPLTAIIEGEAAVLYVINDLERAGVVESPAGRGSDPRRARLRMHEAGSAPGRQRSVNWRGRVGCDLVP